MRRAERFDRDEDLKNYAVTMALPEKFQRLNERWRCRSSGDKEHRQNAASISNFAHYNRLHDHEEQAKSQTPRTIDGWNGWNGMGGMMGGMGGMLEWT